MQRVSYTEASISVTLVLSVWHRQRHVVGCTRQEYRDYLASQFKSGMSHSNYPNWEIDHIVPKKAFKGELEANLQVVYWYGNVQPLWKAENYAKGGKFTAEAKQSLITRFDMHGRPPGRHRLVSRFMT